MNGFTILRVRMARVPFVHVLYAKAHHSKKSDSSLPADRTVFVANAGLGEEALRSALATFGEIERVIMGGSGGGGNVRQHGFVAAPEHEPATPAGDKHDASKHAHVVFSKKRACEAALACDT